MNQITEDYISYETAVLLKEKGFNEDVRTFYTSNGKLEYCAFQLNHNLDIGSGFVSAPTHQMTLKWLREVHKIHINFDIHWLHFANQNGWMYVIERILDNGVDYINSKGDENDATFFSTYEQAVEAALLYVLKNLI